MPRLKLLQPLKRALKNLKWVGKMNRVRPFPPSIIFVLISILVSILYLWPNLLTHQTSYYPPFSLSLSFSGHQASLHHHHSITTMYHYSSHPHTTFNMLELLTSSICTLAHRHTLIQSTDNIFERPRHFTAVFKLLLFLYPWLHQFSILASMGIRNQFLTCYLQWVIQTTVLLILSPFPSWVSRYYLWACIRKLSFVEYLKRAPACCFPPTLTRSKEKLKHFLNVIKPSRCFRHGWATHSLMLYPLTPHTGNHTLPHQQINSLWNT